MDALIKVAVLDKLEEARALRPYTESPNALAGAAALVLMVVLRELVIEITRIAGVLYWVITCSMEKLIVKDESPLLRRRCGIRGCSHGDGGRL